MDYVCDTNVWYDIGAGRLDPTKLKAGGNKLIATALNILEISTNLDARTLEPRQQASQAILDHADKHLEDPERHMASIWSLQVPPLRFDWMDVCRTIVASKDVSEIETGAQMIMKVDAAAAQAWRRGFTDKFVNDVESVLRLFVTGYALARQSGKMGYFSGEAKTALKTVLKFPVVTERQILLTRTRASEHLGRELPPPSEDDIASATTKLLPFVKAYLKLLEITATEKAVAPNDWGDLHCFVYLQDDRKLLTGEKKWLSIAHEAGMADLVTDSKTI